MPMVKVVIIIEKTQNELAIRHLNNNKKLVLKLVLFFSKNKCGADMPRE